MVVPLLISALYTLPQARSGASVFATHCAACHGTRLEGVAGKGPALRGTFIRERRWGVAPLYRFVSHQMPADARGTLSDPQYAAVVAFLLARNGHPAGSVPLTAARAARATARF